MTVYLLLTDCALGMASGAISDSAITASSYYQNMANVLLPSYGRLNHAKVWASASRNPGEYIQIDLGRLTTVTKVATQGHDHWDEWVMSYKIAYSSELSTWQVYRERGQGKVFPGNKDRSSVVYRVTQPIVTRGIRRIIAVTFRWRPALRVEVYECM
ncbi:lactadherin [Nematostella vectensis]|uniref:lactadherin n=1 Tax=Nematostella vectensis TaxID=45351 RepID=UPI00139025F4|nr:lactadherin [Nematostella vectensis]